MSSSVMPAETGNRSSRSAWLSVIANPDAGGHSITCPGGGFGETMRGSGSGTR